MKKVLLVAISVLFSACAEEKQPQPIPDYPDISDLQVMLESGDTTSTELIVEFLNRIASNSDLNAFITVNADGALQRAAELDELRANGTTLSPLHGIPLVVKDNIHVAGLANTAGTPALADFIPETDNSVIASLRDAGAIVLAKTNMHELAFGITSDNAAYGSVANPFDRKFFAGGSSGGTASAISAGIVPAGLGTDTGGSARIPAALTGIVGYRPSNDRYDSKNVTPISHTRDTIGLLSRNVNDLILLDSVVTAASASSAEVVLEDLRIGIPREYFYNNIDAETVVVIDSVLAKLDTAGITFVEVSPAGLTEAIADSAFPIALYEVMKDLPTYLAESNTNVSLEDVAAKAASPDVKGLFAMLLGDGGQMPDEVYTNALQVREDLRSVFADYFASNSLDAIIFPTTLLPARPIDGSLQTVELNGAQVPTFPTFIQNTDPASIAALPGISLPAGLTASGMPVGIEIDGPEKSDARLLKIAAEIEKIIGFSARPSGG